MIGTVTAAARPVALVLLLASAVLTAPAQVVVEDPVPALAAPDPAEKAEAARRDAETLGDPDFDKREAASRRLAALGDAAVPLVQPLLEHEDAEVRARAVLDALLAPGRR